jgi:hypothetical protein
VSRHPAGARMSVAARAAQPGAPLRLRGPQPHAREGSRRRDGAGGAPRPCSAATAGPLRGRPAAPAAPATTLGAAAVAQPDRPLAPVVPRAMVAERAGAGRGAGVSLR